MIYLYSATPGTGKTCWVVKQLIDNWLNDPENANRKIYHNINGLKIDGLYPAPDDFRECDDGSIIIYDEAQDIEHYSSDSRANNPVAKELSKHRHRGFDIHFITQDPSLLHKYVLKNTFMHYYLWRPAQRKTIEIFTFARAIVSPTKTDFKNAFDKKLWRFEERYLQYYKSTVVNTSKKIGSQKIAGIITTGLIFAIMIGAMIYPAVKQSKSITDTKTAKNEPQATAQTEKDQHAPKAPPTPQNADMGQYELNRRIIVDNRRQELYNDVLPKDYAIIKQDPNLQVRGVIKMGKTCQAYNTHGDLMTLSNKECQYYIEKTGRVHKQTGFNPKLDVHTDDIQQVNQFSAVTPVTSQAPQMGIGSHN